jgi:hypothetical protein
VGNINNSKTCHPPPNKNYGSRMRKNIFLKL